MYGFTLDLAAFRTATPGQRHFLAAVAADQQETSRFLGAFAGIVPPGQYFTLRTVVRVLGSRAIRWLAPSTRPAGGDQAAAAAPAPGGQRARDRRGELNRWQAGATRASMRHECRTG